jgi:hypothetical protein
MTIESIVTWDKRIRPYLQCAEWNARTATRHIHEAGYAVTRLIERPEWATNMEAEMKSLEAALECALKDVRTVLATYKDKPVMDEPYTMNLIAAE